MKNIFFLASSLFMMGTMVLFSSCAGQNNAAPVAQNVATVAASNYNGIVYINSDSLISGYKMFIQLREEFNIRAEKAQRELEAKATKFQTEYQSVQTKVEKGLLTRTEIAKKQAELEAEQKVLVEFQNAKTAELREAEAVFMNKVSDAVTTYIDKYNDEKKYQMILNTSMTNNAIVAADPSLDITTEILNGLNKEYDTLTAK